MNKLGMAMIGPVLVSVGLAANASRAQPGTSVSQPFHPVVETGSAFDTLASDDLNGVIDQYCERCHGERRQRGNLTLANFDVGVPEQNVEIAEKMIRKLRAGMMPPPGARRPSSDTLLALVQTLENRIDEVAAANPNPGARTFQRLNRAEYANSVRDLLGLEVDVSAFLPLDTKSANFDNIADVQMPSATLMEGYLRAAAYISRIAVGDPVADPSSTTYRVPRTASQKDRVEGAPFGTRGGTSVIHNFPADGKYVFQVTPHPSPEGELFGRTSRDEQIEISIDGERAALLPIDRWMSESDANGMTITSDSIHVRAGPHRVTAAFIRRFEGSEDDLITPIDHTLADTQIGLGYGVTTLPHLQRLSIVGPFSVTGVSETSTRRAIFTCRPTSPNEERQCAERIVNRLAAEAYRRPVGAQELAGLMAFYEQGAADSGFEGGIRTALQAILASPHFVFRFERIPGNVGADGTYRISDVDLASRLSFFLWGTPPDETLLTAAEAHELSDPAGLDAQVDRMLKDPRIEALGTRFLAQWLRLQDLDKVDPDALSFPYFDATLAEAMHRETELLFDNIVREDHSVLELLTADYTFVNERLARHYGIPDVTGSEFQKVAYPDSTRRGILGHGSVLTLTSHAGRTSPVLRGKWVMEVLLGSPPPPPPPDVPPLDATADVQDGRMLTTRERMEQHRSNPACRSCHMMMDPIGLALDNFGVTGEWRIKENGIPLDTRGDFYDGTPIASPDDLREVLLSRPIPVLRTFTENLMAYALGRRVEPYDQPTIRAITREAAMHDNRISYFIKGVVTSPAFRMGRIEPVTADAGVEQQ
jgi:Protein of unknown function (DUF1592)/Protein of unknown function (DUF1588)/Protein of unknown function (DUF1587)/Protein of unknown function (DUF1585)/Protein of unknown function (DUF1595)